MLPEVSVQQETKVCLWCETEKPIDEFPKNGAGVVRPECRDCRNERRRERYADDPTSVKASAAAYRESRREEAVRRASEWREQNPDHYVQNADRYRLAGRISAAARRARIRELPTEKIDPFVVYQRDEGICGICGDPVDLKLFEIDHVIPIARGGPHLYTNVQIAHPICNRRKGAKCSR